MATLAAVWGSGEILWPAHPLARSTALAIDGLLLVWVFAWLLLPLPDLPPWSFLLLAGTYAVLTEGRRGRTLGKKAMALDVRSAADGGPAGMRRALLRYAVRVAPVAPALIAMPAAPAAVTRALSLLALAAVLTDHGWALRHPLGRTVHDLVAGTVVLRRPRMRLFQREPEHL